MAKTLGQKLRFLRENRQYTQAELSSCLHLERAAYSNYENDKRVPPYQNIVMIADFYDVHIDYLIREDFNGMPLPRHCPAENLFREICMLDPETQKELAEYVHYRLMKKQADPS